MPCASVEGSPDYVVAVPECQGATKSFDEAVTIPLKLFLLNCWTDNCCDFESGDCVLVYLFPLVSGRRSQGAASCPRARRWDIMNYTYTWAFTLACSVLYLNPARQGKLPAHRFGEEPISPRFRMYFHAVSCSKAIPCFVRSI